MDRLVIRFSQKKSLMLTAIFIGTGLFVLAYVSEDGGSPMAWIVVLVMLVLGAHRLFTGFDRSPKIIIDDEGLHFPGLKMDSVSWPDVADAYVEEQYSKYGPRHYVHIELAGPERKKRSRNEEPEEIVFQANDYEIEAQDIVDAILRKQSGLPVAATEGEELSEEGA